MKKTHYIIYTVFLILALVLIGLYFIEPCNPWCTLSCSIGASLAGAVVLGWIIENLNEANKREQNKKIFQVANVKIYREIIRLLTVTCRDIREVYGMLQDDSFVYENKNISDLIRFCVDSIEKIRSYTVSIMAQNGILSFEDLQYSKLSDRIKEKLKTYDEELISLRKEFDSLKQEFEISKNMFLINDVSTPENVYRISGILDVLGTPKHCQIHVESEEYVDVSSRERELLEVGKSLQEVLNCDLADALDTIGFDNIVFNNKKGYFNWNHREEKNEI